MFVQHRQHADLETTPNMPVSLPAVRLMYNPLYISQKGKLVLKSQGVDCLSWAVFWGVSLDRFVILFQA